MTAVHRLTAAVLCAVSGFLVILAIGADFKGSDRALIVAATLGALAAGLPCAGLFGRPDRSGYAYALLGAVLATATGSALAGLAFGALMAQTLAGIIIGPLSVGHALLTSPVVFAAWLGTMVIVHLVMLVARRDEGLCD